MKQNIYIKIAILLGTFNLQAQNVNLSKDELIKTLCKNWEVSFASMNGMKINQLPENTAFEVNFNSDGTLYFIGTEEKGQWLFNAKKKYVEFWVNKKAVSRIKSLSEKEFTAILVNNGQKDVPGLPNLEIHYTAK